MNRILKSLLLLGAMSVSLFAINSNQFINNIECNQTVDKEFFQICYDYDLKAAKAVAYTLSGDLVNENNIDKRPSFKVERAIERQYRASTKDYTGSGYDRGHLACDAAFDWSEESLNATYSLANIIPQARKVNRYTWIKAERYARYVAVSLGEVNIINVVKYPDTPERIGDHGIAVPEGYYKVLYNKDQNFTRCLYYENDNNITTSEDNLGDHVVDCNIVGDLLQRRTCSSFETWKEAQEWFEDRNPGWKRLDGNKDGIACQGLR
jgi:endonuclease G